MTSGRLSPFNQPSSTCPLRLKTVNKKVRQCCVFEKDIKLTTACAIQSCLTRTNYNEQKCQDYVDKLYKCCRDMYAADSDSSKDAKSTACPIKSVVDRRIKAMEREGRV